MLKIKHDILQHFKVANILSTLFDDVHSISKQNHSMLQLNKFKQQKTY